QTILAIEPYLHLSAMAHHTEEATRLRPATRDSWIMRSNISHTTPLWPRGGGGDVILCRNPWSGAGLYYALHLSLYLRGGSLSVSREYWPNRTGVRGRRDINSLL